MSERRILQIVPQLPGTLDGVGDYALNLARALALHHGLTTTFAVAGATESTTKDGFEVISNLDLPSTVSTAVAKCDHVILHYANYGYEKRGVPRPLRHFARGLRAQLRGRWLTTFHEIYASGPPWKSAFWLHPFQVKIARDLIDLSDVCFVSNITVEREIRRHDSAKKIHLAPVMSTFGEPQLENFSVVSPNRWAICGGTALVARSLRSFGKMHHLIPPAFRPERMDVIGGRDERATRVLIGRLRSAIPNLSCSYHPESSPDHASSLLRECSLAWLDYFGDGKAWPGMVLKSTAFAACVAHGVIPIMSHHEDAFAIGGDPFPGPWCMTPTVQNFPAFDRLPDLRKQIYDWYSKHAASERLAERYVEALR
jgi:hypothetical protein